MRGMASICVLGLIALGCIVNDTDDPGAGAAGQGGEGNGSEQGGAAGSSSPAEGGTAGAAENDCSVTEEDDVCSACVKNKCCDVWWACVGDCADQLECYQICLQERESLAAQDDAACREECEVADAEAQTALIDCLLPKKKAGCREKCF